MHVWRRWVLSLRQRQHTRRREQYSSSSATRKSIRTSEPVTARQAHAVLNGKEVAERLGISGGKFSSMVRSGAFPTLRHQGLGERRHYTEEFLEAFVDAAGKVPPEGWWPFISKRRFNKADQKGGRKCWTMGLIRARWSSTGDSTSLQYSLIDRRGLMQGPAQRTLRPKCLSSSGGEVFQSSKMSMIRQIIP